MSLEISTDCCIFKDASGYPIVFFSVSYLIRMIYHSSSFLLSNYLRRMLF